MVVCEFQFSHNFRVCCNNILPLVDGQLVTELTMLNTLLWVTGVALVATPSLVHSADCGRPPSCIDQVASHFKRPLSRLPVARLTSRCLVHCMGEVYSPLYLLLGNYEFVFLSQ